MYHNTRTNHKIFYELQGNLASAETIVFLNGLTQSTLSWGLVTPAFKDKYKILLLDFVFQGQSDKHGDYRDFDEHARDVKEILDLLHLSNIHLVGLSYGSLVAQHIAVHYPDYLKSLTLLSTFAHKTPYFEAIETSWWRALETGGYSLMLDVMLPSVLSEQYFLNPLIPIDTMKEARKDLNTDPAAIFKLMRATKERGDYREKLKQIKIPTLIIHGEKDLLLPYHLAESVHQSIGKSRFILLKGIGHTLNLEGVDQTINAIQNFIGNS